MAASGCCLGSTPGTDASGECIELMPRISISDRRRHAEWGGRESTKAAMIWWRVGEEKHTSWVVAEEAVWGAILSRGGGWVCTLFVPWERKAISHHSPPTIP